MADKHDIVIVCSMRKNGDQTVVEAEIGGRLLGVHLTCHRGAELINSAPLAVSYKLTIEDMANTLHVYPSMGEGLRLCAQGFSRDLSKLSCCAE
jgi:mercuric reductase